MLKLTAQQRDQLMQILEGSTQGSYQGALVVPNLAEDRDKAFIAEASFCTLDEIDRTEKAFDQGGVESIAKYRV